MKTMAKVALMLSVVVCATSASAGYFFNSRWGTMLNVGSAPNPTPDQLRAIGDSPYVNTTAKLRREPAPRGLSATAIPVRPFVATKTTVGQEKITTAELNRASLLRARTIASNATAVKAAKAVATKTGASKSSSNTKTAGKSAAPVKAGNYFFNSQWGTMLNIGSAPNPTPDQLRAIGDSKYVNTAANPRLDSSPLHNSPGLSGSAIPSVMAAHTFVATKTGVRQEKFVSVDLNRASLVRARVVASNATAIKAAKAVATKTGTAKTASTTKAASKSEAPVKAAVKAAPAT